MRTPAINLALERALSQERLGRYLADSAGILDAALSLYERNSQLSEAFYSPLQCLEICLRNHLDLQLSALYGQGWFQNGGPPFSQQSILKIDKAIDDLKRANRPISHGAVVAELSFGFWVAILGRRYDATLWRQALTKAFSENGRGMARQRVHNRMNELRDFRNRVAHHEPIYHLNPAQVHADIIEALGWMCADSAAWAAHHSRVAAVLDAP